MMKKTQYHVMYLGAGRFAIRCRWVFRKKKYNTDGATKLLKLIYLLKILN